MLTFEDLILDENGPIYSQIVRYVKQGVAGGTIHHGEELPSRRVVSALLGVNPNTVQKAYRLLEDEGLIQSHAGAKSRLVADEATRLTVRTELLRADARTMISAMKQMGVTRQEALALLDSLWEEGEEV